jgi:predicted nuclease with TOPRIM domain
MNLFKRIKEYNKKLDTQINTHKQLVKEYVELKYEVRNQIKNANLENATLQAVTKKLVDHTREVEQPMRRFNYDIRNNQYQEAINNLKDLKKWIEISTITA